MASIINAGSGSNAELTEPYTTQASQHSLLFGIGGEADTKFPLPTGTSWVVVELHFIEANESTIAYTEWFDKLNDISARLIEIQDDIEADPLITNYKMVASHYDYVVANKVDVYRGEHLDGSARVDIVLDSSNVDFTFPIGNWKLSDTVLAPSVWAILLTMNTFNVTATNTRTIDNAGSTGATDDTPMYGSNHIYLNGIDQYVDIPVNSSTTDSLVYYDYATKVHIIILKTNFTTTTYHRVEDSFSNLCTLSVTAVTADTTYLDAHPEALLDMWFGASYSGDLSFVKADIQQLYPAQEGDKSHYYDAYGNELYTQDISEPAHDFLPSFSDAEGLHGILTDNENGTFHYLAYADSARLRGMLINIPVEYQDSEYIYIKFRIFNVGSTFLTPEGRLEIYGSEGSFFYGDTYTPTSDYTQEHISWISNPKASNIATNIKILINTSIAGDANAYFDIEIQELVLIPSYVDIVNHTAACKATYENTNHNLSNLLLEQDGLGGAIGMATTGTITGADDGRYLKLPLATPQDKTILKDVDKIEGDDTSLTIYYTDETTEEIT